MMDPFASRREEMVTHPPQKVRGTMIAEGSFSEVMNDKAVQASYLGGA